MISKLLPVLFLILGTGAGIGAAVFLADAPGGQLSADAPADKEKSAGGKDDPESEGKEDKAGTEFVRLNNQFVVPLVAQDRVSSLVVVSLSLEVTSGTTENVYSREPKLRDLFLRVLFDHANMGGFKGSFTDTHNLELLRTALREVAGKELGGDLKDVLITDIARQDK